MKKFEVPFKVCVHEMRIAIVKSESDKAAIQMVVDEKFKHSEVVEFDDRIGNILEERGGVKMMDTFAQNLDEAFWGLKATDTVQAMRHLENIKELVYECEKSLMAELIPVEMVVC